MTARISRRGRTEFRAPQGGAIEEIRTGDVAWLSPGEKHWHGAGPTAMTHIAIQEKPDEKVVDWMEHVSGEQFRG